MEFAAKNLTMGQMNAIVKMLGGEEGALRFLAGNVEVIVKSVLDFVATVVLPAQPRFVARDHFKVDTSAKAKVKIAFIWSGFQPFLEKTEEPVGETTLAVRKLTKDLLDKEIRKELGGEKEETTLSQFWAMLEKQGHGQAGELLTNGYANIFYIRDAENTLWAVRAYWDADRGGWDVHARSVTRPPWWHAEDRVVSRN